MNYDCAGSACHLAGAGFAVNRNAVAGIALRSNILSEIAHIDLRWGGGHGSVMFGSAAEAEGHIQLSPSIGDVLRVSMFRSVAACRDEFTATNTRTNSTKIVTVRARYRVVYGRRRAAAWRRLAGPRKPGPGSTLAQGTLGAGMAYLRPARSRVSRAASSDPAPGSRPSAAAVGVMLTATSSSTALAACSPRRRSVAQLLWAKSLLVLCPQERQLPGGAGYVDSAVSATLPLCGCRGGLPAGRQLSALSGHDQNAGLVVDISAGSVQGGTAEPVVVTAQQQIHRARMSGGCRNNDSDHWPGRAAAGTVGVDDGPGRPRQFIVERGGISVAMVREPALH